MRRPCCVSFLGVLLLQVKERAYAPMSCVDEELRSATNAIKLQVTRICVSLERSQVLEFCQFELAANLREG